MRQIYRAEEVVAVHWVTHLFPWAESAVFDISLLGNRELTRKKPGGLAPCSICGVRDGARFKYKLMGVMVYF
jgi:hypothetical protein